MKTWFLYFFKNVIHHTVHTGFRNLTKNTISFKGLGLLRSNKSVDTETKKTGWYLPEIIGKYDKGILVFKCNGE